MHKFEPKGKDPILDTKALSEFVLFCFAFGPWGRCVVACLYIDRALLCIPGCSWTYSVTQAGFKFVAIPLTSEPFEYLPKYIY